MNIKQHFPGGRGWPLLSGVATLALACVIIFTPAKAQSATLYSQLNYGSTVYPATGANPDHARTYSPASSGPSWDVNAVFYTTTATVPNIIQFVLAPDNTYTCSSFVAYQLFRSGSILARQSFAGVGTLGTVTDLGDGICQASLSGISAGTDITAFSWASGVSNGTNASLSGSSLNSGYSGNDSQGNNMVGGPAFQICNTTCSESFVAFDTTSRIISMIPENGTTTASTTIDFSLHAYINQADFERGSGVQVYLHNIDQNTLFSTISPNDIILYDDYATSSGDFYFSTSTSLSEGNYRLYARLRGTSDSLLGIHVLGCSALGGYLSLACYEASTQFTVVSSTFLGLISQTSYSSANTLFSSTSATSTQFLQGSCNVLSGFSVMNCLAFLFVPDSGQLDSTIRNFRDNVATHFPLGYVTDFMAILSTTTESTLTVLSATVPSVLPGSGSVITLSLSHVLDSVLYATSGPFTGSGASSTATFYDVTSSYWRRILYLLAFLYILSRILGVRLIPSFDSFVYEYDRRRAIRYGADDDGYSYAEMRQRERDIRHGAFSDPYESDRRRSVKGGAIDDGYSYAEARQRERDIRGGGS